MSTPSRTGAWPRVLPQIAAALVVGLLAWSGGRLHGGAVETATIATRLGAIEHRLDAIHERIADLYTGRDAERDLAVRDRALDLLLERHQALEERVRSVESTRAGR